ncbi:nuclease associated modular domain 3, partial [Tanacetum coccineum]
IATVQYSFRNNNLYTIGLNRIHYDNNNVSLFSGNRRIFRWSSGEVPVCRGGRLMIKAVATLEPMCSDKENDSVVKQQVPNSVSEDKDYDEKERLRRNRISKANKGREAWNKGVKHSPETRQKIRERTKIAMRNPEVKKKLMKGIHNQTRETRQKIAAAVRQTWDRRRFTRRMIARCHREWLDLIAEASRKGLYGEEELQWNSYEIMSKKLDKEFREGIELRKKKRGSGPGVRAPKTLEQRKKISEAIAAKWADPVYRDRVYSGIAKHRGKDPDTRDPEWGIKKEPKKARPVKKKESSYDNRMRSQRPKLKTSSGPVKEPQPHARFKDPQARYKLEMIKSIRAQRAASDPKISEAILRANILIGEAQRAAEALEAAAAKSPMAEASLIETRKLIAEAISYIKSIETGNSGSAGAVPDKDEIVEDASEIEQIGVNGAVETAKFGEASLQTNVNGMEHVKLSSSSSSSSSSTSSSWSDLSLKMKEVGADGEKQEKGSKGRRWVCGRLVEVDETEDQDEDKDAEEDDDEDEDEDEEVEEEDL